MNREEKKTFDLRVQEMNMTQWPEQGMTMGGME